jgi:S-adenosylmethionine:tRNA ribosyltransferase-isomerase
VVNKAKADRKRVCAVGTTSIRAIESSVSSAKTLNPFVGWTNKFIFPPYDFSIANCMITNFHTPKSTLLMMISAFCGHDLMKKAYDEAIKEGYRFYSYGDAMLII